MINRSLVKQAVRQTLYLSAAAAGMGFATVAQAQQSESLLPQVIVTGSRIASTDLESATPVQTIGAVDIQDSGAANIQDVLLKNPAFGTPAISRTNSNFSTSSAGVSTVDLRDLGTARTLVLVNGRRFVSGVPGDSAVDLNSIPAQFIDRIEVLTGGASAVYGSDAVAGVVNIIYKTQFEGVELVSQYGESSEGDAREWQASLTLGTNVAEGRGNVLVHLGYSDQGSVFSRDRARSAVDQNSQAATTNNGLQIFTPVRPFNSSYAPQGRFFAGADQYTYNASNQLITGFSSNGTATRAADGFNRSAYRTIAIPTERYLAAFLGDYEVVDGHSVFMEASYASSQTKTALEPFPLGAEDIFPATGGQVPIEFPVYTEVAPGSFTRTLLVNPTVPTAIANSADDSDGDGYRDYYFTRRLAEVGGRGNTADRGTFRIVGGVKGGLGDSTWKYEGFYGFGQTSESQVSSGQVNVLNFRNALEAVPDVNDVDGDGNVTEAICRDDHARAQGCVPASVFGRNALSAAAVKYITAPGLLTTFTSQNLIGVSATGEVVDLPAGAISLATGVDYRKEYARTEFDPLQQAGLNAGNAIPRTEGEFSVKELYVEAMVPLLSDLPMAQVLNLRTAYRHSDYSTTGTGDTWNAGLEWSPVESLRFRLMRAQSTRAPNINELFSPPSQTYPTGLADPCVGATATSSRPQDAACRSAAGVAANIAANNTFTLNQSDLQGISGFDRGNPNAKEEIGRSWVVGAVYTPANIPVLSDFDFTLDYYSIDVADALVSTGRQFILEQCYTGGTQYCQFIKRRPAAVGANSAGSIEFIDSAVTNSGGLKSEGIDLTVAYNKDLKDWGLTGEFSARLSYTHLMNGYEIPLPGATPDSFEGEVGSPDDSAFVSLSYRIGDLRASWSTTFIGKSALDDQYLATKNINGVKVAPGAIGVGSVMYHDLRVSYTLFDKHEVYVGAKNLFDKEPAPIISGVPGNDTGTETNAGVYDPIGRQLFAGVRVKF